MKSSQDFRMKRGNDLGYRSSRTPILPLGLVGKRSWERKQSPLRELSGEQGLRIPISVGATREEHIY
jgi:hypothetical protein